MPFSPLGRRAATAALAITERVIGRPRLARLARWVWLQVRFDIANDPSTNGEYLLLRSVCREVSSKGPGIFLDVGANLGDWSDALIRGWAVAGRGAPRLEVHAFEPTPACFLRLTDRLADSVTRVSRDNITTKLNDLAVGRAAATMNLSVVSPTGGTNTLVPLDGSVGENVPVQVVALDDYATLAGLQQIDFLKIDTEGNDFAVLEGASGLLESQRIRWAQFEYNHRWVSSRTYLRDVFLLAEKYGYKVGKITPRGIEGYEGWHPELETFREGNYLLWHGPLPAGTAVVPWWVG